MIPETRRIVYDEETYPNCFTLAAEHVDYNLTWSFEISDYRDDSIEIIGWFKWLKANGYELVGFNNVGFDYPVVHGLLQTGRATARQLYDKAMAIIQSQDFDKFAHMVKPSDRYVPQIDLFKIHHFDNKARATSLKVLEFNMRMENLCDLPFPVGTVLNQEQIKVLKKYNAHDVRAAKLFYHESLEMIKFREELTREYNRDFMNHNDTKIGKDYFIMRLEDAGISCYEYGAEGRKPRQTRRSSITLKDIILPIIRFNNPEFNRILTWMKAQVITETKGVFEDVKCNVGGCEFVFGLGGIHGSIESETVVTDDDAVIVDIDVESYYPSTAIAQRFKPAHYPDKFCDIYADLKEQRKVHKKGTAKNATLKLGLNGVFGDSNNQFSVFFDPQMTMSITVNGQLLLCMLVEALIDIPGLRIIQANTDGITVKVPRQHMAHLDHCVSMWEIMTQLKMEKNIYKSMMIRDVNNYIAVYEDGKVKRKGAYEHDMEWHQNHGALVIAKVAEQVLVHGKPIRETLEGWTDIMDFMLRVKVPKSSKLVTVVDGADVLLENTQRYYVAKGGTSLFKIMPPLAKKPGVFRRIGVESGWGVCPCNDIKEAVMPIDYAYYQAEIDKIVLGVM